MPRSIFGWSYPPGCSGPPDDYESPCECCGESANSCICPECPVCGSAGDPKCYAEHGMVYSEEQLKGKEQHDEIMRQETLADDLYDY